MLALMLAGAADWAIGPFLRPEPGSPILAPNATAVFECPMRGRSVAWESDNVFNPCAVVRGGRVYLLYRAEDGSGAGIGEHTSRIGLAVSRDGIHFEARPTPVLFPAEDGAKEFEWPGGCEDPRIVEADGGYVLTYTGWNRKTARLEVATSRDLIHWVKHGPALSGALRDQWSKSGSIVTRVEGDHLVAARIKGRYWMYWGEGTIRVATSDDLISWTPVDGGVISPQAGMFDATLAEPGPAAVLTERGIVFIYNGKGVDGSYSAGQILFDRDDPDRVLDRTETPFLKPERAWERTGQYEAGTVFTEGLVHFKGKWILYYGAADSRVGCAVAVGRR